jgi:hypothetical protein
VDLRAIHAQPRNRPVALEQHLGHGLERKRDGSICGPLSRSVAAVTVVEHSCSANLRSGLAE